MVYLRKESKQLVKLARFHWDPWSRLFRGELALQEPPGDNVSAVHNVQGARRPRRHKTLTC